MQNCVSISKKAAISISLHFQAQDHWWFVHEQSREWESPGPDVSPWTWDQWRQRKHCFHTLIYSYQSEEAVTFTLLFMTSMIFISMLQNFRSWVAILHLRRIMTFFISQLIRYTRACSSYLCYIQRAMWLANELLGQEYVNVRLSSFQKLYGQYGDLLKQYKVPLSRILMIFWTFTIFDVHL